jgi:Enolase C-terminal domain-like
MTKSLDESASNLVTPDLMRIGGVSGWLRAAALAGSRSLPMSSHPFPEYSAHLLAVTPTDQGSASCAIKRRSSGRRGVMRTNLGGFNPFSGRESACRAWSQEWPRVLPYDARTPAALPPFREPPPIVDTSLV